MAIEYRITQVDKPLLDFAWGDHEEPDGNNSVFLTVHTKEMYEKSDGTFVTHIDLDDLERVLKLLKDSKPMGGGES